MAVLLNLFTMLARPLSVSGVALTVVVLLVLGQAVMDHVDHLTPATLTVDGLSRRVRTQCSTVGEVLEDVGVGVQEWDVVIPGLNVQVQPGMTIFVQHARPVTIAADGRTHTVYTHSESAIEVLNEAGVFLRPGDALLVDGDPASETTVSVASRVEVQRAVAITLVDGHSGLGGGVGYTLYTRAKTLDRALAEADVVLYLGDSVYPGLDTTISSGLQVRIQRGVPVHVLVDGRTLRTRTQGQTVGQVLAELGISLLGRDYSVPAPGVSVRDGLRIEIIRVSEETIVEQSEIPYETVWVPDPELELDHRRLDDAGANGITRRRYKVVYHNGQEVNRYLEAEWTAQEPHARQIVYGTRIIVRTAETPHGPIEYWRR
ncbi:MAG: DUF348 domain-containing protein, partial [Anaerolineae bacterium]|nr:DUF348 domain-containing protein [Anaerolineae bacterium]